MASRMFGFIGIFVVEKYFDVDSFQKYLKYVIPWVKEALDEVTCKKYIERYRGQPWMDKVHKPNVRLSNPPKNSWEGCDGHRQESCSGKDIHGQPCHAVIDPNNLPAGYDYRETVQFRISIGRMNQDTYVPTKFKDIRKPIEPLPPDVDLSELKPDPKPEPKPKSKPAASNNTKDDTKDDTKDEPLTGWTSEKPVDWNSSGSIGRHERMM